MKNIFMLVLILFISGCTELADDGPKVQLNSLQKQCSGFKMLRPNAPLFWSKRLPVVFAVNADLPSEYIPKINEAMAIWNNEFLTEVFKLNLETTKSNLDIRRNNTNTINWITDWTYDSVRQGSTFLHNVENNIVEADIIINAEYKFAAGLLKSNEVDLVSLMVHELGHVLGLDHTDDEPSIMKEGLSFGQIHRILSDGDVDNVLCMY
jgi:predicted Zn-dependent protease